MLWPRQMMGGEMSRQGYASPGMMPPQAPQQTLMYCYAPVNSLEQTYGMLPTMRAVYPTTVTAAQQQQQQHHQHQQQMAAVAAAVGRGFPQGLQQTVYVPTSGAPAQQQMTYQLTMGPTNTQHIAYLPPADPHIAYLPPADQHQYITSAVPAVNGKKVCHYENSFEIFQKVFEKIHINYVLS